MVVARQIDEEAIGVIPIQLGDAMTLTSSGLP